MEEKYGYLDRRKWSRYILLYMGAIYFSMLFLMPQTTHTVGLEPRLVGCKSSALITEFKTAKPKVNESPKQFSARLERYLMRWIELAKVDNDCEKLKNFVIRQHYPGSCPVQLAVFLTKRKLADLDETALTAEQYKDAHTVISAPWYNTRGVQ